VVAERDMTGDRASRGADPDQVETVLPLMASQLGMRDGQLAEPSNPAYSIAMLVWFADGPDPQLVRQAAEHTCRDAEATNVVLRLNESGVWSQTIDPDVAGSIDMLDFSPETDPERAFRAWLSRAVAVPFELVGSPLLRQTVAIVDDRVAYVAIAHHMVIDGFGAALVQRRLVAVFAALTAGADIPANPFATLTELAAAVRTPSPEDLPYWTDYLNDGPPILSFSADVAAPAPAAITCDTVIFGVRRHGQMWTRLMIAAIAAYVTRYTGMDEAVVGVPVSNRRNHVERRTPAMLMTVMPLRVPVDRADSLRVVARNVGRTMAALSRQTLQRSETLRHAVPSAWRSGRLHGPIANIVPFEVESPSRDMKCTVEILNHGPVEDVSLLVAPGSGTDVRVELTMNPRLYTEAEAEEHMGRLAVWLQAASDDPDCAITDMPFLTADEERAHERVHDDSSTTSSRDAGAAWDQEITPAALAVLAGIDSEVVGALVLDRFGERVPFGRPGQVWLVPGDRTPPIQTDLLASIDSESMVFRGRLSDVRVVHGKAIDVGRLAAEVSARDGVRSATVDPVRTRARLLVEVDPGVEIEQTRRQLAQLLPTGVRLRVSAS
jgi:hypothetical protein